MKQKRGALWWRIPLLALAFCGILAFLLPMTMGIVNIGSVTILIFAVLIGLFATFFDGIARLLKRWWQKRAGKTVLSFLAAVACLAVLTAGVLSGFMAYAATRTPPDTAAVVVLGCKVNGTTPSLMLTKRLETAKRYLDEHPDKVCIVSGGRGAGKTSARRSP